MQTILFLCTGNSCRSLLSEAVFNHLAPEGWRALSAGSQPTGQLNPRAVALLQRKGISTESYYSKSWDALPVTPDVVITVCGSAAGETCPAYLGAVLRAHWGVEDPSHLVGSDEEIEAAFEETYRILRVRIEAFLAAPTLSQAALDRIGTLGAAC